MDQNPSKKAWRFIRTMFLMLKKNISNSKTRIFADLNMLIIKRGKIAGKSLHSLLFHHHHHRNWAAATLHRHQHQLPSLTPPPSDDDFSCTTTPQHLFSISSAGKKHNQNQPPPPADDIDEIVMDPGVIKAVEMLKGVIGSPGFGKSPMVKQLRITDSPFPLVNGEEDGQVDEAAEKFILKFLNGLRRED
ncbi:hypothetical protein R6Q59_036072 [Mikania micrantha]|uniref:Uncharacterized protein n=1 Tax=Mikania micrantha TaxID=192012 RepID=A0A5N6NBH1_9ASTR|nr:hypothetical protein E3N88_22802 [Mikania micrantha]